MLSLSLWSGRIWWKLGSSTRKRAPRDSRFQNRNNHRPTKANRHHCASCAAQGPCLSSVSLRMCMHVSPTTRPRAGAAAHVCACMCFGMRRATRISAAHVTTEADRHDRVDERTLCAYLLKSLCHVPHQLPRHLTRACEARLQPHPRRAKRRRPSTRCGEPRCDSVASVLAKLESPEIARPWRAKMGHEVGSHPGDAGGGRVTETATPCACR